MIVPQNAGLVGLDFTQKGISSYERIHIRMEIRRYYTVLLSSFKSDDGCAGIP